MGFWSSLGKGLAKIGADLIPGIGPIVGPIVGGVIDSVQTSKASNVQQDAAKKAADVAGQVYGQQQGLMAPYYTAGVSALGQMTGLQGLPAPGTALPAFASLGAQGGSPQPAPVATATPAAPSRTPANAPMTLASLSSSSYGNNADRSTGGMVTLQSPDGQETQQVPESQAPFYISQGARRVG